MLHQWSEHFHLHVSDSGFCSITVGPYRLAHTKVQYVSSFFGATIFASDPVVTCTVHATHALLYVCSLQMACPWQLRSSKPL